MQWTKSQYLIALFICKIVKEQLKESFPEGKYASLIRRVNNFMYVVTEGREGEEGDYKNTKSFFEEYKNHKIRELEAEIKRVIKAEQAQGIYNYLPDKR